MSTSAAIYPIVAAVKAADTILGPDREWKPVNETQARFLKEFFAVCRNEHVPEIESLASWNAEEITDFLAQRGFFISIPGFSPPSFGTASVLDVLVEWVEKGVVTKIKTGFFRRRKFPAVRIAPGYVKFFRVPHHRKPLASVQTKSGDMVYMTMFRKPPEGFDLIAKVQEFSENKRPIDEFLGFIFPWSCSTMQLRSHG